ncbi:MAG: hypothetical protein JEZ03_04620 [Bacteroidales bacterium]|nr:hypothetical protein [Bacteroidales bacterium]
MKRILFSTMLTLVVISAIAQDNQKFGIRFSGFLRTDLVMDTRKTVESREGYFSFFPKDVDLNDRGEDQNAVSNFSQYSMASRLRGNITGPDAFGAKITGVLEGDFTGPSNLVNNGFRLRLAYIQMDWKNTRLMIGQNWHAFTIIDAFPNTLALNTGAPFHAFSRQPQIQLQQKMGDFKVIGAISTQRDFVSNGPETPGVNYMRYSMIPDVTAQLHYKIGDHLVGVATEYKMLSPRTVTDSGYIHKETIQSKAALVFSKFQFGNLRWVTQAIYGENLFDQLMIGGYGVSTQDSITDIREYSPLAQYSLWTDLNYTHKMLHFGVFAGFLKNIGSQEEIIGEIYSRGKDLDYIYRVAPRVSVVQGKLSFIVEGEYTVAAYGEHNEFVRVEESSEVANFRLSIAAVYKF